MTLVMCSLFVQCQGQVHVPGPAHGQGIISTDSQDSQKIDHNRVI